MEVYASTRRTVARYAFSSTWTIIFSSTHILQLLGHFEHLHVGQLSHASFADSRTLVTCGADCTISLWTVTATSRAVDLQPIGSLFGHRAPVTVLAVSRSFSALLSASNDGHIMLWDLNRRGFVRTLPADGVVDVSSSPYRLVCYSLTFSHRSAPASTTLLAILLCVEVTVSQCTPSTGSFSSINPSATPPMTTCYPAYSTKARKTNGLNANSS